MLIAPIVIISASVTIGFNIPIARQIIGFVYISFIPGFLILRILRLNLNRVDTIVFSVSLSVTFLMFVGLFVNELYPLIGISEPLSTLPLLVTSGTVLLALSFISYRKDNSTDGHSLASLRLNSSQVLRGLLLIGVPLLAITGAWLTNSLILILMVTVISVLTIFTIFSKRLMPFKLYPLLLFVIAAALLFHYCFISKYLVGWDVFTEFYVFNLSKTNSLWSATISSISLDLQTATYNAMLSVTVLPTIYSKLLNIQGEWIFQIIYPLFFSLVPVSLYQTYRHRFGELAAFLSSFYFILFPRFYLESSRRQWIGELFFVLLIFLMLKKNISPTKRRILLVIFGLSLVVSHYSLSYIYLFCISFAWFFMFLMKKPRKILSGSFVLLFFLATFSWYTYVSSAPSIVLVGYAKNVSDSFFHEFLSPEARGTIAEALHFSDLPLIQQIDRVVCKLPYFFILIGIIEFFRKKHRKAEFEREYSLMVAASFSIFLLSIIVPRFSTGFVEDRLYHIMLLFLAPICVLGSETLFGWFHKTFKRKSNTFIAKKSLYLRLVCILFIIIFLFKVGLIYELTGEVSIVSSKPISFERMRTSHDSNITAHFYTDYFPEQDVSSAIWLSKMAENDPKIYADYSAILRVLRAYANIMYNYDSKVKYVLKNNTEIGSNTYIYLRGLNVNGTIITEESNWLEYSDFETSHLLNSTNLIYSNGYSEIFRSFPGSQD